MKDRLKNNFRTIITLIMAISLIFSVISCDELVSDDPYKISEIKIAYDPNKADLFETLVSSYNKNAKIKVNPVKMEIADLLNSPKDGQIVAVSPDSSIWLDTIDNLWQRANPDSPSIVGTTVRYATTPVIIAVWQGQEDSLGKAGQAGWNSLLNKASKDSSFKWSHGSPKASASGMLALIAEFYVGAGKTYGLTKQDADNQTVREYVANIQKTISRYGGDSDAALVDYLLQDDKKTLSAVVLPEASVFDFNRKSKTSKLKVIQPSEGTLMLDHPLVLLERTTLNPEQRKAFLEFARFLTSSEAQSIVAEKGYRPIDLAYDMEKSPLVLQGISVAMPSLMQLPSPGTVNYLREAWASGLKRRANIILLADVSGSMAGLKMSNAQNALLSFIDQVPSDEERVGLAIFSTDFEYVVKLDKLANNRKQLIAEINDLYADGKTALYYAIWRSHRILAELNDKDRINVVVAMTDGQENASINYSQRNVPGVGRVPAIVGSNTSNVTPLLNALKSADPNILIFTIGYGSDADMKILRNIATEMGGQAYTADTNNIRKLYELISQNF